MADRAAPRPRVLILMGVSGSGKTTIGRRLAAELGWPFYDADDYHSAGNIERLRQGVALTDGDRAEWLDALHGLVHSILTSGGSAVLACSALRQAHRDRLLRDNAGAEVIYLRGDYELIRDRLEQRHRHFMNPALLRSQFETLEEPQGVVTVDIDATPDEIVTSIRTQLP
ncbi:MAG TPA: gluconokinase [Terriglobales bacterium]|nr:gluconokinase [Terriglobales bacterium]